MHRNRTHLLGLGLMLAVAGVLGCQKDAAEEGANADSLAAADSAAHMDALAQLSLYDRLGGAPAIQTVVDDFVARAAADDTLNFTRQGTANAWEATPANIDTLKLRLVEFIGSATGGPEVYSGQDMATAHTGMAITNAEFDRLAGHLQAALVQANVPEAEQQNLLAVVETTRSAIVQPAP